MGLRKIRPGRPKGNAVKGTDMAPVFCRVSCAFPQRREVTAWKGYLRAKYTLYPWRDSALLRSLPCGISPLILLVLLMIEEIVLIVFVSILNRVIQFEEVVFLLVVVLPFIEAFERRFEGFRVLLILLNIREGSWEDRCLGLLIDGGESRRKVQGLLDGWHGMTQAKVLGEKRIPYLTCPRIQGMALDARLHPNRPHLLPKMLLRIADDLLYHVVRQQVVRFILDGDTRHRDAPLPLWSVAAALCGHRPAASLYTVARHACSCMLSGARGKPSLRQAKDCIQSQGLLIDYHTARFHPLDFLREDGRELQPKHLRQLRHRDPHSTAQFGDNEILRWVMHRCHASWRAY